MEDIHVIGIGEFGATVAEQISQLHNNTSITLFPDYRIQPSELKHAKVQIIASGRTDLATYNLIEELSYNWKVPWVAITMEQSTMCIGPVVVPGEEGCYECFHKRKLQHSRYAEYINQLNDFYKLSPEKEPKGYLSVHAGMAASILGLLKNELLVTPEKLAGSVYEVNIVTGNIHKKQVIGFHGCPKCGLGRDEKTRSYEEIIKHL